MTEEIEQVEIEGEVTFRNRMGPVTILRLQHGDECTQVRFRRGVVGVMAHDRICTTQLGDRVRVSGVPTTHRRIGEVLDVRSVELV